MRIAGNEAATRREYGSEKPYTIIIEQNENRAFLITLIEPQNVHQQNNIVNMNSEVLKGKVQREDALGIKNMLQDEEKKGNRFVSFPLEKDGLKREDFTSFKTAIKALEYADKNSNEQSNYNVLSIRIVDKEIDKLLENRKEQAQEQKSDNKRFRDQGLSR